ncbi:cytidine deaminase [Nakamurella sp. YIM 132087]|uniref:Cytidine deaminase n=1 Tax=Nakamurella alba TaxID=2665158 RepID=A0A7K1FIU0_9ACTN|nr:cytidine deaminase [Nakamurella alba]MTD13183.1 cytidine deaminase [Nakamurella alba]
MTAQPASLPAEDEKLVTLAKGARGRAGAAEGAAVRDQDGRTYAAATVRLPSFSLTAVQAAVATAVASGAEELEAVVLFGSTSADEVSIAAARDMSAPLLIAVGPDGAIGETLTW